MKSVSPMFALHWERAACHHLFEPDVLFMFVSSVVISCHSFVWVNILNLIGSILDLSIF